MRKCPFCAEEIQDEAIKCRYCGGDLTVAKEEIKKCPSCKEEIKKGALKCPHCGESLFFHWHPNIWTGIISGCILGAFSFYLFGGHIVKEGIFNFDAITNAVIFMVVGGIAGGVISSINDSIGKIKVSNKVMWIFLLPIYVILLILLFLPSCGKSRARYAVSPELLENGKNMTTTNPQASVVPETAQRVAILDGIFFDADGKSSAIINGKVVFEGDSIGDIGIDKINQDSVDIIINGQRQNIKVGSK